jgi:polyisoprenoid-binding protein YceI
MGTWQFDPFHTQVEFSAKHLGMMAEPDGPSAPGSA